MPKALIWNGTELVYEDLPSVPLQAQEVRIWPLLMGICNTDLELIRGYRGFVGPLGHEFVGEVIEGHADWLGQRVVGDINLSCQTCEMCAKGLDTHCFNRTILGISGGEQDGAFAESFRLPIRNLHRVPATVSDEQAVFTEPLAAACRIPQLHDIGADDKVILIGAGKLGMLCAQVIAQSTANLWVVVRRSRQADLLEKWGIRAVLQDDKALQDADYAVDCTGNAEGFAMALKMVRPRGTVVLKSTFNGLTPADLTEVSVREIRLEGSRCGPFDTALHVLEQGSVDVTSLIEAHYPLSEAHQAMEHAAQRGVLKVLLSQS